MNHCNVYRASVFELDFDHKTLLASECDVELSFVINNPLRLGFKIEFGEAGEVPFVLTGSTHSNGQLIANHFTSMSDDPAYNNMKATVYCDESA